MRLIKIALLIMLAGCLTTTGSKKLDGKWQIVNIQDTKAPQTNLFDFNYQYNPAEDTTRVYLEFLNDSIYTVSYLFSEGIDTNHYFWNGDTLITNREPRDYLVLGPRSGDTAILFNKAEKISFTLVQVASKH